MENFNNIANEYGYKVDNEGFIFINDKSTNTRILISGKNLK